MNLEEVDSGPRACVHAWTAISSSTDDGFSTSLIPARLDDYMD